MRSLDRRIHRREVRCGLLRREEGSCDGHYGRHAWRSDPMAGRRSFQMELHPWALGTALTRTKEAYLSVAPDMYGGFASSGRVESFTSRVERN